MSIATYSDDTGRVEVEVTQSGDELAYTLSIDGEEQDSDSFGSQEALVEAIESLDYEAMLAEYDEPDEPDEPEPDAGLSPEFRSQMVEEFQTIDGIGESTAQSLVDNWSESLEKKDRRVGSFEDAYKGESDGKSFKTIRIYGRFSVDRPQLKSQRNDAKNYLQDRIEEEVEEAGYTPPDMSDSPEENLEVGYTVTWDELNGTATITGVEEYESLAHDEVFEFEGSENSYLGYGDGSWHMVDMVNLFDSYRLSGFRILEENDEPDEDLSDSVVDVSAGDLPDYDAIDTKDELKEYCRKYAKLTEEQTELEIDFSLTDWEIDNAKRRAGGVKSKKIRRAKKPAEMDWEKLTQDITWASGIKELKEVTFTFSWRAFQSYDEAKFRSTIRHECIHAHEQQLYGKSNHDKYFKRWADKLDTTVNADKFTDYKYEIYCEECGELTGGRHKRSKVIKKSHLYNTQCCSADLRIEENDDYDA